MRCGNGSERAQHPVELFGDDWYLWPGNGAPGDPEEAPLCQDAAGMMNNR
jgi:hypothetical protein